ncbi:Cuticlin-1 [Toxocara canis]|uniref:Cuticlin-1 n=1 Tax=Toxocara canis TaxID=6265 RepID=A0A0B2VQ87_TOXCA|nr:Cuticlin-1 [Toxocara canis]
MTFTIIALRVGGSPIDNGVLGEPTVECLKDNLRVNINTEKEFEGHVYVKGHYDEEQCRADATLTQHVNLTVPFSSCDVRRERSVGEPTVECLKDNLRVNINTEKEFEGHVYVKGHYDEEQCRADATLTQHVNLTVPFSSCDVRRERSSNPKGLFVSVTVIVTFHPMFITKIDKSYNVKCFYTETERTVTTQLDVSLGKEQEKKIIVLVGGEQQQLQSLPHKNAFLDDSGCTPGHWNVLQPREANTADALVDISTVLARSAPARWMEQRRALQDDEMEARGLSRSPSPVPALYLRFSSPQDDRARRADSMHPEIIGFG